MDNVIFAPVEQRLAIVIRDKIGIGMRDFVDECLTIYPNEYQEIYNIEKDHRLCLSVFIKIMVELFEDRLKEIILNKLVEAEVKMAEDEIAIFNEMKHSGMLLAIIDSYFNNMDSSCSGLKE